MHGHQRDSAKGGNCLEMLDLQNVDVESTTPIYTHLSGKTQLIRTDVQQIVLPMAAHVFFLFLMVGDQHCLRSTGVCLKRWRSVLRETKNRISFCASRGAMCAGSAQVT